MIARPLRPTRRAVAAVGLLAPLEALAACADPASSTTTTARAASDGGGSDGGGSDGGGIDTSANLDRIRTTKDETVAAKLPAEIADRGSLIVGTGTGGAPPLVFLADDNKTTVGTEPDLAQLVADKLGLDLDLRYTSWDDWPLKLGAGEYDAVHFNVGITPERLEKFDFAPYRSAFIAFLVPADSGLDLTDHTAISGLAVAVAAGTTQERVLTDWNAELTAAGKKPAEVKHYSQEADVLLALGSGRVDAYLEQSPTAAYTASQRDDFVVAGRFSEGWPDETLIAATLPRGSGLVDAYAAAIEAVITDGTYAQVLDRWGLADEALTESRPHTKENP